MTAALAVTVADVSEHMIVGLAVADVSVTMKHARARDKATIE